MKMVFSPFSTFSTFSTIYVPFHKFSAPEWKTRAHVNGVENVETVELPNHLELLIDLTLLMLLITFYCRLEKKE